MTAKATQWKNMKRALRNHGWLSVGLFALAVVLFLVSLSPLLALRDFRRGEMESYTGRCRVEESRFDKWGGFNAYTFTTADNTPLVISKACFTLAGLEDEDVWAMGGRTLTYTYSGSEWLGYRLVSVAEGEKILISSEITWMERADGDGWLFVAILCVVGAVSFYVRPLYRDLHRRYRPRPPRLR